MTGTQVRLLRVCCELFRITVWDMAAQMHKGRPCTLTEMKQQQLHYVHRSAGTAGTLDKNSKVYVLSSHLHKHTAQASRLIVNHKWPSRAST